MGTSSERAILDDATAAGRALRAVDVLKVAHHGSKSSTSSEWLDTWRPQIAVISVGRNNMYRHPHPTVMARLEESGTDIFRTDLHGEVRITVGPQAFDVEQIVQP
jgi:competence protein ComEC